jgi:hypothetical protein
MSLFNCAAPGCGKSHAFPSLREAYGGRFRDDFPYVDITATDWREYAGRCLCPEHIHYIDDHRAVLDAWADRRRAAWDEFAARWDVENPPPELPPIPPMEKEDS